MYRNTHGCLCALSVSRKKLAVCIGGAVIWFTLHGSSNELPNSNGNKQINCISSLKKSSMCSC